MTKRTLETHHDGIPNHGSNIITTRPLNVDHYRLPCKASSMIMGFVLKCDRCQVVKTEAGRISTYKS